ncbi:hypothetical protein [Ectopseudomonas guguanensis]|jgi:hypothetical protein|uniref:hypothetical protein n=1 Tax=Ectopseudomonas guguanensis TaxID=1198456 RepID=UPI0028A5C258|nr:hypothetical protein [Pseudomonas guguanensis]
MYIIRLSLFCVAALLVNGAYAKDFSDSSGASAKTAELTLSNSSLRESRVAVQPNGAAESSQQGSRSLGDDAQWLRISNEGDAAIANRERPGTPRWVF